MKNRLASLAVCALFASATTSASGAVITYLWEDGGNIEAQASGTLDLTGLTFRGSDIGYPDDFRIQPNGSEVLFFGRGDLYTYVSSQINQMGNFGTGSIAIEPGQSEGDHFGWEVRNIVVPVGFQSGDSIFSTGRILGTTFADLGIVSGTYTWALPNDTISLRVGQAPSPVPLPAGFALLLAGMGALGLASRRQR